MTDLRKAAEMALEFVEWLCGDDHSVKPKNNALKTREALRQALAQPDEVLAEREACAKVCEGYDVFGPGTRERFAEAIRARSEKPLVKTYCGGKPNYCTPDPHVDAVNMSQKRVDETAKREHEWVGLTEDEVESWRGNYDFFDSALVKEVEAKLKEKNT